MMTLYELFSIGDDVLPRLVVMADSEEDARSRAGQDNRELISQHAEAFLDTKRTGIDILQNQDGVIYWTQ